MNDTKAGAQLSREFRPRTTAGHRLTVRGDFGDTVSETRRVDGKAGVWRTLKSLADRATGSKFCSSLTAETEAEDREHLSGLTAGQRLKLERMPAGPQRCQRYLEWSASALARKQVGEDRRRLRDPPPSLTGQWEIPGTGRLRPGMLERLRLERSRYLPYYEADRAQRAKMHVDRARQMTSAGMGLLYAAANAQDMSRARKGNGLIWRRDMHLASKKCALWELYRAYVLLRDLEMNPLPPLILTDDRIVPNPERVVEEKGYVFLMGTWRMEPNRLALGQVARLLWWTEEGILDPHVSGPILWSADGTYRPYAMVYPEDAVDADALGQWLGGRPGTNPEDWPMPAEIDHEHAHLISPQLTDVSQAMFVLHSNFGQLRPDEGMPEPSVRVPQLFPDTVNRLARTLKTRLVDVRAELAGSIRAPPYVVPAPVLGVPWNGATWPFNGSIEFPMTDERGNVLSDLGPLIEPSGESVRPDRQGPPYRAIDPVSPWGLPAWPFEPDQVVTSMLSPEKRELWFRVWDGRQALAQLMAHRTRLDRRNHELVLFERSRHPDIQAPLQGWPGGPLLRHDEIRRVPPTRVPAEDANELGTVGQRVGPLSNDALIRPIGLTAGPLGVPTDSTDIPTPLTRNNWTRVLPQDREAQVRMLQHALFLLSAPTTYWLRTRLSGEQARALKTVPRNLRTMDRTGLLEKFGAIGRKHDGGPDPTLASWATREHPYLSRTDLDDGRSSVGPPLTRTEEESDVVRPMGPLWLSPSFTVTEPPYDDLIGPLWVIDVPSRRTLGTNTWNVDFWIV